MATARRLVLPGVCLGMALAVLTPLLGRGFTLTYDMVFAARQSLLPESVGLSSALPRSVPADAVVALLTAIVPGDLVQQGILLAALFAGPLGAGLLVPTRSLGVRVVAAVTYGWSAYVAERLFIGHWPYLVAYACLPWLARAAIALRANPTPQQGDTATQHGDTATQQGDTATQQGDTAVLRAGPTARRVAVLALATAPAVLTPTGGILAAGVAVACGGTRRLPVTLGLAALLNAPWWVPAVLHPGGTLSASAGVAAFAARAESWGGETVSLLGLGGIWNAEVTPASRTVPITPILTIAIVAVALFGLRELGRRFGEPARALVLLGALGVLLASFGGTGLLSWVVETVPGGGLLRDSQKWVAWWALPLALGFALGAEAAARQLRRHGRLLLAGAAVIPVAMLPDLALAGWGRLHAVDYPPDWAEVRHVLATDPHPGDVVALPLSTFRQFSWNGDRTQLDPAPRVLPRTTVIDDTLVVNGRPIPGEDPRAAAMRRAVVTGESLGELGIGWVLVERGTPGPNPVDTAELTSVYRGRWLNLYRVPGPVRPDRTPTPPVAPVLAADAAALAITAVSMLLLALPTGRMRRAQDGG